MSYDAHIVVPLLAIARDSMNSTAILPPIADILSKIAVRGREMSVVDDYYSPNILHAVQHIQESLKCISELCLEAHEGSDISYLVNAATKLGEVAEMLFPNRPTGDFPGNVISVDFQLKCRA